MGNVTAMQRRDTQTTEQALWHLPNNLEQAERLAQRLAKTNFVPPAYRGKPDDVLAAMMMGIRLRLDPLQSCAAFAVVNGVASLMAKPMLAIVTNHPQCRDVEEWYDSEKKMCVCRVYRSGRKAKTYTYSVEDAKVAGLWGKCGRDGKPSAWVTNPKRMLQYRARSFALQDAFPDVLMGLVAYEEAADYSVHAETGEDLTVGVSYVSEEEIKVVEATLEYEPMDGEENPAPKKQNSALFDKVVSVIEQADTRESLRQAGIMVRQLTGEEKSRAIQLGVEKQAELDAMESAKQAARAAETAAAEADDESGIEHDYDAMRDSEVEER